MRVRPQLRLLIARVDPFVGQTRRLRLKSVLSIEMKEAHVKKKKFFW